MADEKQQATKKEAEAPVASGVRLRINPSNWRVKRASVNGEDFTHAPSDKIYSEKEAAKLTAIKDENGLQHVTIAETV